MRYARNITHLIKIKKVIVRNFYRSDVQYQMCMQFNYIITQIAECISSQFTFFVTSIGLMR